MHYFYVGSSWLSGSHMGEMSTLRKEMKNSTMLRNCRKSSVILKKTYKEKVCTQKKWAKKKTKNFWSSSSDFW